MSIEDHQVSFSLELNVAKAYENVRRLETIIYRTMGLMRQLGLPENIDQAISKVQSAIAVLNQYRLTVAAAQAASGPYGWALLGISVGTTIASTAALGEQIENEMRGR